MEKWWLPATALILFVVLAGLSFYLRPSPQEALILAASARDVAGMKSAMERGADATQLIERDYRANISPGLTPFQLALSHKSTAEELQVLLKRADLKAQSRTSTLIELDLRDGFVATPLHYVVLRAEQWPEQECIKVLQLLFDHGAPLNAKAKYPSGVTPLMLAKQEWVMRYLLESGADPNLVTADNACLMNYSGQEPSHPLWKLLKKHGGRPRLVPDSPKFPRPIFAFDPVEIKGWKYGKE